MSNKLKKEDIGRVTRFLKKYSVIKKEDKLKDISDYLEKGHSSEILSEEHFILEKDRKLNVYAHTLVFKNKFAKIRNLVVSEYTTERDLAELMEDCINYAKSKNCKTVEITIQKPLEKFFINLGFKKIGEKQPTKLIMSYQFKEDKQISLQEKFKDVELMDLVSKTTAEKLRSQI
ncbi:GNAT family N-acetyltransferase [Candidatus Woesearchaeota archaeon]|jgi:predicted GNAT family N-acyltransferase|nr:GNAT family N-acetyltransferase [Candidatus Woesearchaeota archaeon]MBT3438758.1 GNAT family N-acetyltransferase [Candidatus Woesearchaeota archaeon]MBT4058455.1 GNAT family N-acetyltransferase [Candidatus Woesearchaeota archaeon]MBT4208756.1 GNAT family N-acetyltransferase [Candidatus Woesearchaeota archaeon]MBT4733155.1 GNAT family N-acetyltransferase [Candidatus Woesearchaeota archaeon]